MGFHQVAYGQTRALHTSEDQAGETNLVYNKTDEDEIM